MSNKRVNDLNKFIPNIHRLDLFEENKKKILKLQEQRKYLSSFVLYLLFTNILLLGYSLLTFFAFELNFSTTVISIVYNGSFSLFWIILYSFNYKKSRKDEKFKNFKNQIGKNFLLIECFILTKLNVDIILAYSIISECLGFYCDAVKALFLYFFILNAFVFNYFKVKLNIKIKDSKRFLILLVILFVISILISLILSNQINLDYKSLEDKKKSQASTGFNKLEYTEIGKFIFYIVLFLNNSLNLHHKNKTDNQKYKIKTLKNLMNFLSNNYEDNNKNGLLIISSKNANWNRQLEKIYETNNFFENLNESLYTKTKINQNNYINKFNNLSSNNNFLHLKRAPTTISNINFIKNLPPQEAEKNGFFSTSSSLNNLFLSDKKFVNNKINNSSNNNNIISDIPHSNIYTKRRSSVKTMDSKSKFFYRRIPYSSSNLSMIKDPIKINLPKRVSSNPMITNDINPLDQIEEISEGEFSQIVNKNSKNMIRFKKSSRLKLESNQKIDMKKLTPRNSIYLSPILNSTTFKLGSSDKVIKKSFSNKKNNMNKINHNYPNLKESNLEIKENSDLENILNSSSAEKKSKLFSSTKRLSFLNFDDPKLTSEINQFYNSDILSKEIFAKIDSSSQSDSNSMISRRSRDNDNASNLNNTKSDYNIKINDDQNLYLEYCNRIKSNREITSATKLNFISKLKNNKLSVKNIKNINVLTTRRNESDKSFHYFIKIDKKLESDFDKTRKEIMNARKRLSNPEIKISVISEKIFEDISNENEISKIKVEDEIYDSKISNYKNCKKLLSTKVFKEEELKETSVKAEDKVEIKTKAEDEIEDIILKSRRESKLSKLLKEEGHQENNNNIIKADYSDIDGTNKFLNKEEKENLINPQPSEDAKIFLVDEKEKTIYSSSMANTSQNLLLNEKLYFLNKIERKDNRLINLNKNAFPMNNVETTNKVSSEKKNNTARDKSKFNKLLGFELSSKNGDRNLNNSPNSSFKPLDRQKSNPLVLPSVKNKFELSKQYFLTKDLSLENANFVKNKESKLHLRNKNPQKLEFFKNNVFISIFSGNNTIKKLKENFDLNFKILNLRDMDTKPENYHCKCNSNLIMIDSINAELVDLFTSTSENGSINFNYFLNSFISIIDKNEDFTEAYDIGPFIIKPDENEIIKSNNTSNNKAIGNLNLLSIKTNVNSQIPEYLTTRKIISISLIRIDFKFDKNNKEIKNYKYLIAIKELDSFLFDGVNAFNSNLFSNSYSRYYPVKEKFFTSSDTNNVFHRTQIGNPSTFNLNINQNISINNNNNDYNNINTIIKEDAGSNTRPKRNYIQNYPNSYYNLMNQISNSNTLSNVNILQNNALNQNMQNNLYPNYSNSYKFTNNQIRSSLSSKNFSYRMGDQGTPQMVQSPNRSVNNNVNQNNNNLNNLKSSVSFSNISNNINIINNNIQSGGLAINNLTEKLSAILHDFKHVVYDNVIFFEFLVNKYILKNNMINSNNEGAKIFADKIKETNFDINTIKDEINYFTVMKDYTLSLILNITNFISNNEFLVGEYTPNIDLIKIINIMIKIFNRRLEYENSLIKTENETDNNQNIFKSVNDSGRLQIKKPVIKLKNIKIKCIIIDPDNPCYTKVNSNQNLLISLFYNVLSNSYKYTENGEITVELSIVKLNNKNNILVKIRDSGKGIPQEILDNWGKPFNFFDKSQGTGLGQFIISTIEKNLGLFIPKPEKNPKFATGTIFKIYIPLYNDLTEKGTNVNMAIIGSSAVNPFNVQQNQSSFYLKSTRINNQTFQIEENLKNFLEYDENALSKINFFIRTIYIVCLDDELMFLNALNKSLKGFINILEFYKFEVIFTSTFNDFLNEFINLLNKNIVVDFFIFDQNISENIKGLDCSRIVNNFYKIYFKDRYEDLKYYFFFITEDSEIMKKCAEDKKIKKFLNKDQIFGKMQFNEMCIKIKNIIQDKDRDIIKPSQKSFILN